MITIALFIVMFKLCIIRYITLGLYENIVHYVYQYVTPVICCDNNNNGYSIKTQTIANNIGYHDHSYSHLTGGVIMMNLSTN